MTCFIFVKKLRCSFSHFCCIFPQSVSIEIWLQGISLLAKITSWKLQILDWPVTRAAWITTERRQKYVKIPFFYFGLSSYLLPIISVNTVHHSEMWLTLFRKLLGASAGKMACNWSIVRQSLHDTEWCVSVSETIVIHWIFWIGYVCQVLLDDKLCIV